MILMASCFLYLFKKKKKYSEKNCKLLVSKPLLDKNGSPLTEKSNLKLDMVYFNPIRNKKIEQPVCHTHKNINLSEMLAFSMHCNI